MCHFLCAQQCAQEPISTCGDLIGTGTKQAGKENFSQLECGMPPWLPPTKHLPFSTVIHWDRVARVRRFRNNVNFQSVYQDMPGEGSGGRVPGLWVTNLRGPQLHG